jgi:Putative zinc-finger
MFHLTDRLLAKLIDGSATSADVQRIRRHIDDCRACARRLEEWRDNYTEVDERFPELALESAHVATVTPGGLVMLPGSEPTRRYAPDLTTLLWIGAVLMALLVGYGASRLRNPSDGMAMSSMDARSAPHPHSIAAARPAYAVPDTTRADSTHGPAPSAVPGSSVRVPAVTPAAAPSRPQPKPDSTPAAPLSLSPHFRNVLRAEAARKLGGPLRVLPGLTIDHIEVGPAVAVPGAQPGLDVIRVIYRTPKGGPMLLDQQLIPAGSDGLRPIDDPTLESGETAYGSAPNGVSVATWLDEDGYRISLAAQAPLDSLKRLVQLVR